MDMEAAREELERLLERYGGAPELAFFDDPEEEERPHPYVSGLLNLAMGQLLGGARDQASASVKAAVAAHGAILEG